MFDPAKYPAALPHEPIEELFQDIFLVHGSIRPGLGMRMNRNMVVLRQGDELTIVSPVRLMADEEARLDALGKVKHVIRIGYFHGLDDRFYVDKYGAEFWCQPGSDRFKEPRPTKVLEEGIVLPIADAQLFCFREGKFPEAAILIQRNGGVLISSDSLQHWTDWSFGSLPAKLVMRAFGFSLRTLIGTFWLKYMTPKGGTLKNDFERLLKLKFRHLIGAHGRLCRDNAHAGVEAEIRRVFGSGSWE